MRVGLVCPYSLDVPGGVQRHVTDLAESLGRHGHEAYVLAPGERSEALPPYVTTTGRAVPVRYNGSVARISFGPLVAGRVRRWLDQGRFDVVHLHEPASPSLSVLALWASRAPVVGTFHTSQDRPWALETSAATFLRAGLDKVSAHIAVSAQAAATLERYQDVEPVVIPNGVQVSRFAAPSPGPGERPAPGPTLVFVGRVDEPRKGLPVLLDAFGRILQRRPETRLRVIGPGTLRLGRRWAALRDHVELLGAVSEERKVEVLRSADVLVAPNTGGESFGIVLVEALAAGTPVVASDLPAFREVLSGGGGSLFRSGDPADLAAQVTAVLEDPWRHARLARGAREAARRFDWEHLTPAITDVYRGALAADGDQAAG